MLHTRHKEALEELKSIIEDLRSYPINYNHYYTNTITKRREDRQKEILSEILEEATQHVKLDDYMSTHTSTIVDINQVVQKFSNNSELDMERFSCEEALDCLLAIYKVSQYARISSAFMF